MGLKAISIGLGATVLSEKLRWICWGNVLLDIVGISFIDAANVVSASDNTSTEDASSSLGGAAFLSFLAIFSIPGDEKPEHHGDPDALHEYQEHEEDFLADTTDSDE